MRIDVLTAGLAVAVAAAAPARAAKQDVYALVGARVLTVAGAPLESATLVLRDGVIAAVGTDAAVPPDARVIDARGLTLTPGLIDGFGSVGLPRRPRGEGRGEEVAPRASARDARAGLTPEAAALDQLDAQAALKARDKGLTTVLVVASDGVLPGRSVLLNLSGARAAEMVLRQPAALHLQMTPLRGRYPSSLMGVTALARQALLDAARYRALWEDYERAPAGKRRPHWDPGLEAWQEVSAGRLPLMVTAPRENDLRRALRLRDEFGVRVIAAGALQAARVAPLLREARLPLLVSVNYDPPRPATFSFFGGADEDAERREIEEARSNPAALHRAGVPFALVSGHAADFLGGVRTAIEKGLPREAALRAVTLGAAEVLGVADRLGSLEPGKLANVVAWQGEPLTAEAKVKLVFVDGALHEPEPTRKGPEEERGATAPREATR